MLEKGQHWELFGYDMRRLGRYWIAAWRDLLWAHDSPVRQRLDEVVQVQDKDRVSYYQAGSICPGAPASDCRGVLLPDDLVLSKQIRVPLQAESELATILDLEIRASSPFAAADTRWGWTVVARDESGLAVALVIVSASATMAFLGREYETHEPGSHEVWVAVDGAMVVVKGFGEGRREQRYRRRLLHTASLVAVIASVLLVMAGVAALFKSVEMQRLERMSAATREAAAGASRLRTLVAQAHETINAANEVVAQYPNPHAEIARLTHVLGDDAFLLSFSMEGTELRLRGKAVDAALVMQSLTDEPGYKEVSAPTAFSRRDSGLEQFSLDISLDGAAGLPPVTWLRVHQRTAWICGLTLLLPLLLYLGAVLGLLGARQASQAEIDRMAPRIARMQGLIQYEDQLREAAAAVQSQVQGLVYPASADRTTVAAMLQTNVRDIFSKAGLSVSNSLVMPEREQGNFDYIGVKLTVSGELASLDEALVGIADYLPLLLVESIVVTPARVPRVRAVRGRTNKPAEQQLMTANLQLLSLRAAQ